MKYVSYVLLCGIAFVQHTAGLIASPYSTYRSIIKRGRLGELLYLGSMLLAYFSFASAVHVATLNPYLLTRQFAILSVTSAGSVFVSATTAWLIARLFGGVGRFVSFLLAWSYTTIPTVLWFLSTSLLYVILPPPRTTSVQGVVFSLLFLVFSTTLLLWKIVLVYLALRFGMRMDLSRIAKAVSLGVPIFIIYSIGMYRLGVFRIPFL